MSEREAVVPLRHMRDAAARAIEIARGLERQRLDADSVETLALTRLVEIVGEAVRRIPKEVVARHPQVPWSQIAGTRDRLIHGYDEVDLDILWNIVGERLPVLVGQIDRILAESGAGPTR